MVNEKYHRGSEWRKWDLHIHTPASFHWSGKRFSSDPCDPINALLVDEMINAMNTAEPAVFAIMDYWTFDGWFALKHRLTQENAPELKKIVFPGIELRLVAPMTGRLNAHVLFSNEVDDQVLHDFQGGLNIALIDRPLSNYSLKHLARFVGEDLLQSKGFKKSEIDEVDDKALEAGSMIAEITCESYKKALLSVPNNMALGFMPFDTNDGLADVKWQEHYAYVLGLFETSPIFETRNSDLCAAFAGVTTETNKKWVSDFQRALKNTPRLAVSGSDAHQFVGVQGDNNRRGYGDYPSGKITWIKANPTFEGLQQAIREPAKRSFIGRIPPKLQLVKDNRSLFIDKLLINKDISSTYNENWLDGTELTLNHDLVAIIGNKGSGKSALADVIAFLGDSKQSQHFSFLQKNRFKGKTGVPAKHFDAQLLWEDKEVVEKNLNEEVGFGNVELVKYIPQGHFEELCNAHILGESDAFEKELRSVIFSHADNVTRSGAYDFEQLINLQENPLLSQIDGLRSSLHGINREIASIEEQMTSENRKAIEESLDHEERLLQEHSRTKPTELPEPTNALTEDQQVISAQLADTNRQIEDVVNQQEINKGNLYKLTLKRRAYHNIVQGVEAVKSLHSSFKEKSSNDAEILNINLDDLLLLEVKEEKLEEIESVISNEVKSIETNNGMIEVTKKALLSQKQSLSNQLNVPQREYQNYLELLRIWTEKHIEILGSVDMLESIENLKHRIDQLDQLPEQRTKLQMQRIGITEKIFDKLEAQRFNRELLFRPVQELIQNNNLIRNDYKLRFKAEINSTPDIIDTKLFRLIKKDTGEFRGENEGLTLLKSMMDEFDIGEKKSLLEFVVDLDGRLDRASNLPGVKSLLRKGSTANEVYDFIFGLEYLEPRYTLMFQDAHIEQLSPGQRGSLLLIFYLLVDKGDMPIILDQPEENLDNETVVSLLVPVLTEAKQKRQIIMVTHNPNLAVVCDAEQIIHCEFDRTDNHNIKYFSGAIESSYINSKVVDILEGTIRAFNNRRIKYIEDRT